jgi:hypothetical protein
MRIPDSKVTQFTELLEETGVPALVEAELAGRPGPAGLPVRAVLVGLMLAVHYTGKATLAEAARLLAFSLSPTARAHLDLPDDDAADGDQGRALVALSRRLYRAFDRLTSLTDPARTDRRRRLPQPEADRLATAWHDHLPGHQACRELLQTITTALVLAPVHRAAARGQLRHWNGDVGIDTTAVPAFARPPRRSNQLASIEITAGWHYSAGSDRPTFGYSATLAVAAHRRDPTRTRDRRSHPQLALGLVLDTPGKRTGPNAITALTGLAPLGQAPGLLAVDRAYTDQTATNFARPARELGYQLVLDYKQDRRGIQGSVHGAPLIDGNLACPLTPTPLAEATTGLDDKAVRAPSDPLLDLITAREPFYLKLKQGPDPNGAFRLQCPAAGTSPAIACPRRNRLLSKKPTTPGRRTPIDLTHARQRAAHQAAKPTVTLPADELHNPPPPKQLPQICRQQTITVHPDDLGDLAKLRQELHYLTEPWTGAYKAIRAQTEGINGRLKSHFIDLDDPKHRLAHGQAAQTILTALMVMVANLHICAAWEQTRQPAEAIPDTTTRQPSSPPPEGTPPSRRGRPPPAGH